VGQQRDCVETNTQIFVFVYLLLLIEEKIRLMKKYCGHKMCFIFLCCVYFIYFPLLYIYVAVTLKMYATSHASHCVKYPLLFSDFNKYLELCSVIFPENLFIP